MKTSEIEILVVPGNRSGDDHWQTRWRRNLKTARQVEQANWQHPDRDAWVGTLISTIAKTASDLPLVLIAHSLGVATVAHAAAELPAATIAGAFLVAPADVDHSDSWPFAEGCGFDVEACGFKPLPKAPMSFPSVVVASSNDPYCSERRARALAEMWGSNFISAGACGHINSASGHGPWPEGLMQFGWFLKRISELRGAN